MYSIFEDTYRKVYTNCRRILENQTWGRILQELDEDSQPGFFADKLLLLKHPLVLPDFIVDLARLEWALHKAGSEAAPALPKIESISVNPTLALVPVSWTNLVAIIHSETEADSCIEKASGVHILVWRHLKTGKLHVREAGDADLLGIENHRRKNQIRKGGRSRRCDRRCHRVCHPAGHFPGYPAVARIADSTSCTAESRRARCTGAFPVGGCVYASVAHHPDLQSALQTLLRS